MRNAHRLTRGKSKQLPHHVIYMDSESRINQETLVHTPYLICATFVRYQKKKYRKEKDYTTDLKKFWIDCCDFAQAKTVTQVWAHNMGYDLMATGAIPVLESQGFRLFSFFEKGGTLIYKFMKVDTFINEDGETEEADETRKTLFILSSTNFYPQKLKEIGKVFGENKIDIVEEYETDYNTIPLDQAVIYCRQDVKIVEVAIEAMREFIDHEELGVMGKTAASQAFNAYRHRFMHHQIFIHDNIDACNLERNAYYGGRVECFHIGKLNNDTFYYADVNSMYPYVMRSDVFPVRLLNYAKENTMQDIIDSINYGDGVIAHVKIKTDFPYFPKRHDKKLIFPIGEFYTYLATPELKFAIDHNLIVEIKECSYYELQPIFKDFVEYFYNRRMQAKKNKDAVRTFLYKLIMNCLYGKFGQLSDNWERVGDYDFGIASNEQVFNEDGEIQEFKILSGSIFEKKETEEAFNSFPAIAAHVTSAARMHLLKHLLIAKKENVLYMDTDSIFCNSTGYNNLKPYLDEYELGKMKIENQGAELEIRAPKDYYFKGDKEILNKRKGISKDARQLTDQEFAQYLKDQKQKLSAAKYQEFIKTLDRKELTVNMQWLKMNSFIREGRVDRFKNVMRIKKLSRNYTKGQVLKNGDIIPFLINE